MVADAGTRPALLEQREVVLPAPSVIAHKCGQRVLEASVAPAAIFYLFLRIGGFHWALAGALGYSVTMVARRLHRGEAVPVMLLLSATLMVARTIVALMSNSAVVYFLQPTVGTVAVGLAFSLSAFVDRPLAQRFVYDVCPLPKGFGEVPAVHRCFVTISVLFAGVYAVNASGTVLLLTQSPLSTFLLVKTVCSPILMWSAVSLSYFLFRRTLRLNGIVLRWARSSPCSPTPYALAK